jgi:transcriptional regulator with XRE-family HTH domain
MATIYDRRYIRLIKHLIACRKAAGFTQDDIASALKIPQSTVSKIESFARRVDLMELRDWLTAIDYNHAKFLREVGWID